MKVIEFCSPEEELGKQEYDLDPSVVIPLWAELMTEYI